MEDVSYDTILPKASGRPSRSFIGECYLSLRQKGFISIRSPLHSSPHAVCFKHFHLHHLYYGCQCETVKPTMHPDRFIHADMCPIIGFHTTSSTSITETVHPSFRPTRHINETATNESDSLVTPTQFNSISIQHPHQHRFILHHPQTTSSSPSPNPPSYPDHDMPPSNTLREQLIHPSDNEAKVEKDEEDENSTNSPETEVEEDEEDEEVEEEEEDSPNILQVEGDEKKMVKKLYRLMDEHTELAYGSDQHHIQGVFDYDEHGKRYTRQTRAEMNHSHMDRSTASDTVDAYDAMLSMASEGRINHAPVTDTPTVPKSQVMDFPESVANGHLSLGAMNRVIRYMHEKVDELFRLDRNSSFVDLGSGFGFALFHVCVQVQPQRCVGIELVSRRVSIANECLLKIRLASVPLPRVTFHCGNVIHDRHWLSATHIYSFDRCFHPQTIHLLAKRMSLCRTLKLYVSFMSPAVWQKAFGQVDSSIRFRLLHQIGGLSMSRAHPRQRFTCYFYTPVPHSIPHPSTSISSTISCHDFPSADIDAVSIPLHISDTHTNSGNSMFILGPSDASSASLLHSLSSSNASICLPDQTQNIDVASDTDSSSSTPSPDTHPDTSNFISASSATATATDIVHASSSASVLLSSHPRVVWKRTCPSSDDECILAATKRPRRSQNINHTHPRTVRQTIVGTDESEQQMDDTAPLHVSEFKSELDSHANFHLHIGEHKALDESYRQHRTTNENGDVANNSLLCRFDSDQIHSSAELPTTPSSSSTSPSLSSPSSSRSATIPPSSPPLTVSTSHTTSIPSSPANPACTFLYNPIREMELMHWIEFGMSMGLSDDRDLIGPTTPLLKYRESYVKLMTHCANIANEGVHVAVTSCSESGELQLGVLCGCAMKKGDVVTTYGGVLLPDTLFQRRICPLPYNHVHKASEMNGSYDGKYIANFFVPTRRHIRRFIRPMVTPERWYQVMKQIVSEHSSSVDTSLIQLRHGTRGEEQVITRANEGNINTIMMQNDSDSSSSSSSCCSSSSSFPSFEEMQQYPMVWKHIHYLCDTLQHTLERNGVGYLINTASGNEQPNLTLLEMRSYEGVDIGPKTIFHIATRDIMVGEELLMPYSTNESKHFIHA